MLTNTKFQLFCGLLLIAAIIIMAVFTLTDPENLSSHEKGSEEYDQMVRNAMICGISASSFSAVVLLYGLYKNKNFKMPNMMNGMGQRFGTRLNGMGQRFGTRLNGMYNNARNGFNNRMNNIQKKWKNGNQQNTYDDITCNNPDHQHHQ